MRNALLTAAAMTALAYTSAFAAETMTTNPPATTTAAPAPAATTATTAPATTPQFVNLESTDMLSSNVVGLDIRNNQNNDVGKIQDIAFDSSKKVTAYILSVGGFLGMGTHYVAVDPSAVSVSYDATNKVWRATMNATKDELKNAPEFKYNGQWTASRS